MQRLKADHNIRGSGVLELKPSGVKLGVKAGSSWGSKRGEAAAAPTTRMNTARRVISGDAFTLS